MNRDELNQKARRWCWHYAVRCLGFGLAAGCVVASLIVHFSPATAALLGAVTFTGFSWALWRRTPDVSVVAIAEHLNRIYPSLEESAGLWLRDPATLSLVERLQLRRLNAAWAARTQSDLGDPPSKGINAPLGACGWAAAILALVVLVPRSSDHMVDAVPPNNALAAPPQVSHREPVLRSATIEVQPPSYLRRPNRQIDGLAGEVEEGSQLTWNLTTSIEVTALELSGAGTNGPLIAESVEGGRFQARARIFETRLYQVTFVRADGGRVAGRETHLLKVLRDTPPRLTWEAPGMVRTQIDPAGDFPPLPVRLRAWDDHGIAGVHLVMTLAQGSGEGVKFREQTIPLQPMGAPGTSGHSYGKTLDLGGMGFEPGDELYFHAVAFDEKAPKPNQTRSETRFVSFPDPARVPTDSKVVISGIQRVPQLFRSQRQLILDTEQLLAERLGLSEAQFRVRSENIGIDQKLLRLRYGQFLGEEFEAPSSEAPREAQAMEWAAAIRNLTGEDARRAAAIGRARESSHTHEASPPRDEGRPMSTAEMLAPLTHLHDHPEAATLFDEQVKSSLRAALNAMWEAEGFLRVAQPEAALPFENRALEILKAIQQADRISVRRTGYDPPPLDVEGRRLQGDLDTILTSTLGTSPSPTRDEGAHALRLAITSLSDAGAASLPEASAARVDAQLVEATQNQPDRYLTALEAWRSRTQPQESPPSTGEFETLRHALWSLLPPRETPPRRRREAHPEMAVRYVEALDDASTPRP